MLFNERSKTAIKTTINIFKVNGSPLFFGRPNNKFYTSSMLCIVQLTYIFRMIFFKTYVSALLPMQMHDGDVTDGQGARCHENQILLDCGLIHGQIQKPHSMGMAILTYVVIWGKK